MKHARQEFLQRDEGFALIELLIVIAIIGILAVVLVPNLLGARESAREQAAVVYAKNVYSAGVAYVTENVNADPVLGSCAAGYVAGEYRVEAPGSTVVSTCTVTDGDDDGFPEVEVVTPTNETVRHPE